MLGLYLKRWQIDHRYKNKIALIGKKSKRTSAHKNQIIVYAIHMNYWHNCEFIELLWMYGLLYVCVLVSECECLRWYQ